MCRTTEDTAMRTTCSTLLFWVLWLLAGTVYGDDRRAGDGRADDDRADDGRADEGWQARKARAAARYEEGVVRYRAADLEGARGAFAEALALEPSHGRAAANLGQVALELGDHLAAADAFSAALGIHAWERWLLDDDRGADARARRAALDVRVAELTARRALARAAVVTVTVRCRGRAGERIDGDVRVDGARAGRCGGTLHVAPGPHTLEVRASGHHGVTLHVDGAAGTETAMLARLERARPKHRRARPQQSQAATLPWWPLPPFLGAGAAALAAGAALVPDDDRFELGVGLSVAGSALLAGGLAYLVAYLADDAGEPLQGRGSMPSFSF
jgi:hypothetical protein